MLVIAVQVGASADEPKLARDERVQLSVLAACSGSEEGASRQEILQSAVENADILCLCVR